MEALVDDKPNRRKTYAQHCSKGWVIGTSTEHYRCWKIWSALIAAAANLAHVIQHNAKAQHIGIKKLQDLQRLQQLFSETAKQQLNTPAPPKQATSLALPPRVPTPTPLPTLPVVSDDDDSDDELVPPPRVPTHRAVPLVPHPQPTTHHQLSTRVAASVPLRTRPCYTSCPHITMASPPPKLHNDIIQPTCSMQYSMTRLVS
jgi:hypothetical protein